MNVTQGVEEFQGLVGPYQVSELVLQKIWQKIAFDSARMKDCLLYTSPSPRDRTRSRMPSSA